MNHVARMEEVYKDRPNISIKALAKIADTSRSAAQRFLWKKRGKHFVPESQPVKELPTSADPQAKVSVEYAVDKASVTTSSTKITNLQEALTAAKVNTDVWEVDRHTVNWWDVTFKTPEGSVTKTNFQIKASLKPRAKSHILDALNLLTADLAKKSPRVPLTQVISDDPHMLEISIFDLHFGKLAWAAETGTDYDIKIAESLFQTAIHELIAKAKGFSIDKILLPIGSDFLHINSPANTTAKNTPQDVDTRMVKIFKTACRVIIEAIDDCATIAPVKVLFVPGNHDKDASFYLCSYLEAWYNRHEGVTVDVSPTSRKYERYGVNLIGFTHGNEEKTANLPLIMAGERPADWAEVTHREWHLGHQHRRQEMQFIAGDSHGPVMVRILPSLSGTDAWHYGRGFVCGNRAAESYLWSFKDGYTGHFSANVRA